MGPSRLDRLPLQPLPGGLALYEAATGRARLLGLAGLGHLDPRHALLLPRCRSVHTFGMRFPIDVVFLDARGRPLLMIQRLTPGRAVSCAAASAVLETAAGESAAFASALRTGARLGWPPMAKYEEAQTVDTPDDRKLLAALNPRVPLYRDSYNEYFVFLLSAGGAAAGTQVPLYIVMAILGELWSPGIFVAACVVFELAVIFGVARPQMKPIERLGWAALWTAVTALLAVAFYYLVAEPTL